MRNYNSVSFSFSRVPFLVLVQAAVGFKFSLESLPVFLGSEAGQFSGSPSEIGFVFQWFRKAVLPRGTGREGDNEKGREEAILSVISGHVLQPDPPGSSGV